MGVLRRCCLDADDAADDGGARRRRQRGDGCGAAGHPRSCRRLGWKPLTPITVKARDGKTDLYGLLFKPTHLRSGEAVSDRRLCLSGTADGFVRRARALPRRTSDMQSLAELGFIVVCIDGMGTPNRSKSFHEALYGDMGDNTIPDQIAGIKELAAKYPWIDVERVGIYGHSGGGAATAAAMFHFPDFFKVGVSESGNHDNRVYEDDWAEKWIGLLEEECGRHDELRQPGERELCQEPEGAAAADPRNDGRQCAAEQYAAGGRCSDQGEQGLRPAADSECEAQLRGGERPM